MSGFIHLHVHSNYSFCRGANTISDICEAARRLGQTHLALTDINGLYGLVWFIDEAKRCGLQPLVGSYLQSGNHSALVIAKNLTGYGLLCKLISAVHKDDDFDLCRALAADHDHAVVISPDISLLNFLIDTGNIKDIYGELVPHSGRESVLRFARNKGLPVVASNAVYFIDQEDWQTHRLLRAIDLNTSLGRIPAEELAHKEAYFKSPGQMQELFPDCPAAIENTQKIAYECTFNLNFGKFIFPSFRGPSGEDAYTLLEKKVYEGALWRYGHIGEVVKRRLNYELELIYAKGFAPYFLVVQDAVLRAPRTCGRGSAAASLVSYCLGITHVDPVRYDLFFDRFLNPGRIDPPDIDVDFPWDERDDILDYLFKKYGSDCAAMISNHNTFKARASVREVAKVYGLPEEEITAVTKKISSYCQPDQLEKMIGTHPVFRNTELREPWPEIISIAEKIRGFPRHMSVHCGGIVIAPDGLNRYVPTQPAKKILKIAGIISENSGGLPGKVSDVQVVQWEKDQTEDMGLVKIDILGNRSLAVIRDALFAIEKNYDTKIDYARWNPLDDPKTQDLIARGETIGVFYVESPAMRQLQRKTGKGDFEHLVIHSSIIRPAANVFIDEYVRRLHGGSYEPLHPLLEDILKETYGIMVYQEDVSKVAMALAGFGSSDADNLRKIISKKHKWRQLKDFQNRFFKGAQKKGIPREVCEKIWDMILSFSEYSFCKPHSASFALVSYKSAYLRAHYPAEFIAAAISNQGGYYSTFAYISEARRMGLEILSPDINKSKFHYTGIHRQVQVGLMQIKSVTQKAIRALLEEREKNGPYRSFDDFLRRVTIDPHDTTTLVKAGCFDKMELKSNRPDLLWHVRWWHAERHKIGGGHSLSLFESDKPELPKVANYDERTLLRYEIETLGFLLSRHPLTLYQQKMNQLSYVAAKDLHKHIGKKVQTIGWLITYKVVSTKQKQLMEFLSFEDTTAIYETTFFPKTYAKFAHMMNSSRPYVLFGLVEEHFGAISLNVEKVSFL